MRVALRRSRSLAVHVAALVALLLAGGAPAAPVLPPSEALHQPHHMLVAGRVAGFADGRLELEGIERLAGSDTAPATLALRAPAWLSGTIVPGQAVIAAYTAYTYDARSPKTVVVNEAGPLLLVATGLEPALFADSPPARAELADATGSAAQRARAVAGLASSDPQWQNYFAAELAVRKDWHAALDRNARRAIETLVRDRDAHPSARALLLRAASANGAPLGTRWWTDAALAIVAEAPTAPPAHAGDTTPDLVRAAFEALAAADRAVPRATLARWVASGDAVLAEQALLAARRAEPEIESSLAHEALMRSLLPADTRAFLKDHLRRLELMRDAERAAGRDGKGRGIVSHDVN